MSNNFQIHFPIKSFPFEIKHGDHLLFLGSCFSDEVYLKSKFYGFKATSNPFGTIFHPIVIGRFILETLSDSFHKERIIQNEDLFFSWDASASIFGYDSDSITAQMSEIRAKWRHYFQHCTTLFVTFGSAWAYQFYEIIVANCHKMEASLFEKKLSEIHTIVEQWKDVLATLKKINAALNIVFTVSPVRHSKDGLIENNHSKSVLISAIRELIENENCYYFPSYEIVIDELRDYRFFKIDRIHPTDEAIDYVWNRMMQTLCTDQSIQICKHVEKQRMAESHHLLFLDSKAAKKHIETTKRNREILLKQYPDVKLD